MASPVTVITNPLREDLHVLFTLNDKSQLALEFRAFQNPDSYERYRDNGTSPGVIINPAQISAILKSGLVTVYGIATSGPGKNACISMLSPIYNPIADKKDNNKLLQTNLKAVVACASEKSDVWVYYTRMNDDQSAVEIVEINPGIGGASPLELGKRRPGADSNLASFFHGHRFVFYTNTDDDSLIYFYNSNSGNSNKVNNTADVRAASPLAVTTIRTQDRNGEYYYVVLYYMTHNKQLGRAVGFLRDGDINWQNAAAIDDAPILDQTTMIAVATSTDGVNYVYYIPKDLKAPAYQAYVDSNENWRHLPPK